VSYLYKIIDGWENSSAGRKNYCNIDISQSPTNEQAEVLPHSRSRRRGYATQFLDGTRALAHERFELVRFGAVVAIAYELSLSPVYLVQDSDYNIDSG
jgi:hypothetical protein